MKPASIEKCKYMVDLNNTENNRRLKIYQVYYLNLFIYIHIGTVV